MLSLGMASGDVKHLLRSVMLLLNDAKDTNIIHDPSEKLQRWFEYLNTGNDYDGQVNRNKAEPSQDMWS